MNNNELLEGVVKLGGLKPLTKTIRLSIEVTGISNPEEEKEVRQRFTELVNEMNTKQ